MKTSEELFIIELRRIMWRYPEGIKEKENDIIYLLKAYIDNEIRRLKEQQDVKQTKT